MKLILLIATAFVMNALYSQDDWTRTTRNNLYDEVMTDLANYKELNSQQKETIGLCCLESITQKYSRSEYASKIEVEVKRIMESSIDQCAKNIGLQIGATNQGGSSSNKLDKSSFVGVWKTDQNMDITFTRDGKYTKTYHTYFNIADRNTKIENSTVKGNWFIDPVKMELTLVDEWTEVEDKMIQILPKKRKYSATGKYLIVSSSDNYFKIKFVTGENCCQEKGGAPRRIIQGDRLM